MTKIDFYILPQPQVQQRQLFACRLTEKAYKLGHPIYIHHQDEQEAEAMDELLWHFRDSSFIPHARLNRSNRTMMESVQIGHGEQANPELNDNALLINLSHSVPEFFSRFERVSEIVVQEPEVQKITRNNYRFYRDRGYQLQSHDLTKTNSSG